MHIENDYGITVKHDEVNINSHVISYTRQKSICTGVGTLTLVVDKSYGESVEIGDEITLYENSTLVMTLTVTSINKIYMQVTVVLCQDRSKRLMDYFIIDSYQLEFNEASYTGAWIAQFMDEAQVSYNFMDGIGNGNLLSNNSVLGLIPAYDQILNLLQQSGWYMEFDGNGVAQIGTFGEDEYSEVSVDSSRIISLELIRNDKMYRNRGVVWGNTDPNTGSPIFVDISVSTPWDIDSNDKRTFVITNSNISTIADATAIAQIGLDSFSINTVEKRLTIESLLDVSFSTRVSIDTNIYTGSGMVTTFGTSLSSSGLTTEIILEERCPRLFGFYHYYKYDYYYYPRDDEMKIVEIVLLNNESSVVTASGVGDLYLTIPEWINGYTLIDADIAVATPPASGEVAVQIVNIVSSGNLLSTRMMVGSGETTSYTHYPQPVMYSSAIAYTGEQWRFDVEEGASGAKGLYAILVLAQL